MIKRFLEWIGLKEKIHNNELLPSFDEREIWWVSLGENVGHEEDGNGNSFERPFVIIRKFNKELLFGVPCSSVNKDSKYYFSIHIKSKNLDTSALLSQARTISSRRLLRMVDKIGSGVFGELKKPLKELFSNDCTPAFARGLPLMGIYKRSISNPNEKSSTKCE